MQINKFHEYLHCTSYKTYKIAFNNLFINFSKYTQIRITNLNISKGTILPNTSNISTPKTCLIFFAMNSSVSNHPSYIKNNFKSTHTLFSKNTSTSLVRNDLSRYEFFHDLVAATIYGLDTGVGKGLGYGVLPHVAPPTMQLETL